MRALVRDELAAARRRGVDRRHGEPAHGPTRRRDRAARPPGRAHGRGRVPRPARGGRRFRPDLAPVGGSSPSTSSRSACGSTPTTVRSTGCSPSRPTCRWPPRCRRSPELGRVLRQEYPGAPLEEIRAKVRPGDPVTVERGLERFGDHIVSKALDGKNKGCSSSSRCSGVSRGARPRSRSSVRSKKIGTRGVIVAAHGLAKDVAVAVDTTMARDLPTVPPSKVVTRLGAGCWLKVMDRHQDRPSGAPTAVHATARRRAGNRHPARGRAARRHRRDGGPDEWRRRSVDRPLPPVPVPPHGKRDGPHRRCRGDDRARRGVLRDGDRRRSQPRVGGRKVQSR